MERFIILLRGINVSGTNKLPMADLRLLLHDLRFKNVQTYIQSGNIILDTDKSKSEVCRSISEGIVDRFGYHIPVLARTIPEWEHAINEYPFSLENEKIVAFAFLNKVSKQAILAINNTGEDTYKIVDDIVYLNCSTGFGKTKLTNTIIEKKLNVVATTRNYRTTKKLLELAKGPTSLKKAVRS
jgi:uncharacterized protein (DUF1697 family)